MTTEQPISGLAAALAKAQGELDVALKTSSNPFFKSKYADLPAIWECWQKVGPKNGLAILQLLRPDGEKLYLDTVLLHVAGEQRVSTMPIRPMRQVKEKGTDTTMWIDAPDPQSLGSAISYARRYALQAITGIVADVDDDAETASGRGKHPPNDAKPGEDRVGAWVRDFKVKIVACKTQDELSDLDTANEAVLARLKTTAPAEHVAVREAIVAKFNALNPLRA